MDTSKKTVRHVTPGEILSRWRPWVIVSSTQGRTVIVYWRRVVLYALALALTGWCVAAAVVWSALRTRHRFPALSYLNVVLPFRWSEHRHSLGRHYIALGDQALKDGQPADALRHYAAGVARAPEDSAGRRQLALLYARFRQPLKAADLLVAGLDHARNDLPYWQLAVELLAETKQDGEILRLARETLPSTPDRAPVHRFLALAAAQAMFRNGDLDGADGTIAGWALADSVDGGILLARLDYDRGYPELARLRLQQARQRLPQSDALSIALIRLYRDLGRTDDALNEAILHNTANPLNPGPRVDLMYAWRARNDATRLAREIDSYFRDFSGDVRALQLLARFAVEAGDVPLSAAGSAPPSTGRPRCRLRIFPDPAAPAHSSSPNTARA